jgi:hypothetical protein
MVLGQIPLEPMIVRLLGADDLELQGQEGGQIRQDRFGQNGIKKVGAQLRSPSHRRSPAFRKRDEFSLVKLDPSLFGPK